MTRQNKVKYLLTVAVFSVILFGLAIAGLILPDKARSDSERRDLAQAPEITAKALFNREFSDELEEYLLDQFPGRETFRRINAYFRFYGIRQKDSGGIWVKDGTVFKTETKTNLDQVHYAAAYYSSIIEAYLKNCNVYFSVIPDKNYFAAEENGYPHLDYGEIFDIMTKELAGAQYIDIRDTLDISKFYRTDTHWLQPELFETLERIGDAMSIGEYLTGRDEYTAHTLSPFYGVYMQQAALPMDPDDLTYLTSEYTDSAVVSGPSYKGGDVYALDRFDGADGYDVFLGGTQPVIFIENENARTDRELYIFRDSFGSSLTPLFIGAYKKITVIDMRYITGSYLDKVVTFTPGSDVLIINSTLTLNTAANMR